MCVKQKFRNPIGLAFGLVCRAERKALNMSVEAVSAALGIKPSFYKLVENGTNYLHVNKSPSVVQAFNGGMDLDGVTKVLMAISHSESMTRGVIADEASSLRTLYHQAFSDSMRLLSEIDPKKLGSLLLPYRRQEIVDDLISLPAKAVKNVLKENELIEIMTKFLKHYVSFGQMEHAGIPDALMSKLESVPSMYLDFVSEFVGRLANLPAKLGFEEMWRWESENQHLFREWWCYMDYAENIVSEINLQRYHYNYLWEKDFNCVKILFDEGPSSEILKRDFSYILGNLLKRSARGEVRPEYRINDAKNRLKTFDRAMDKVALRSLSENKESKKELSALKKDLLPEGYSSFWVFRLKDNTLAGFYTKVTGKDHPVRTMLSEGVSLDQRQASRNLQLLKQLWARAG